MVFTIPLLLQNLKSSLPCCKVTALLESSTSSTAGALQNLPRPVHLPKYLNTEDTVNIIWSQTLLYISGCHNVHFTMKSPHFGGNLVMSTSVGVLISP